MPKDRVDKAEDRDSGAPSSSAQIEIADKIEIAGEVDEIAGEVDEIAGAASLRDRGASGGSVTVPSWETSACHAAAAARMELADQVPYIYIHIYV